MLGERFTVEYDPKECCYRIFCDGNEAAHYFGYNAAMGYLHGHGVLHTDANNLLIAAFEEANEIVRKAVRNSNRGISI